MTRLDFTFIHKKVYRHMLRKCICGFHYSICLTDHTNKQTITRLADTGMHQKYDDAMFEDYRKYLGELYKSPQDYIYLSL